MSLEQAVAAPYVTRRLADAGARVIKLERSDGDFARGYDASVFGLSSYFVWLNHGKESVCFDLKSADDIAFLHRLLANADVFVQNLAPGATARAGIASSILRSRYPRLITCDITGYGIDGPLQHLKAYDLLVQAESGLAGLTGTPEGSGRVGVSVCDIACGMSAHAAILQALYARERSGVGRALSLSLFHSIADWMNVPYLQTRYGALAPSRNGLAHPSIAPYGLYSCLHDQGILIAVQNEREWERFARTILENADLVHDTRFHSNVARVEHRAELDAEINAVFAHVDRDDLIARLQASDIAYGRLTDIKDLAAHPQNRFISIETPAGSVQLLEPPGGAEGRRSSFGAVPRLGAHTSSVHDEFSAKGTDAS